MTAQEQCDRTSMSVTYGGPRDLNRFRDAVLIIGNGLDLATLPRRILEAAVDLVDASYGALGILDHKGDRIAEFLTVGDDDSHTHTGNLLKSLGPHGSLVVDGSPFLVARLGKHPDSSSHLPGRPPITSFIGAPIRVQGEVFANLYLTAKSTSKGFDDVDEELVLGLAAAAGLAIEHAHTYEDGRFREAAMAAMNDVAASVLAGADQRSILELVTEHARTLLAADTATISLPARGGDEPGVTIPECRVGGVPRAVRPAASIGPSLVVALLAEGQPLGTLTVARSPRAAPFTAAECDVAKSFADQAGAVLQHERVRQHQQRLVLLEDQARVGRDLHDTVIQRLFAIGLALQGAAELSRNPDAQHGIGNALDELDRTIGHIRTVIFDIETSSCERGPSMRAQIVELAHNAARGLGFQPQIVFTGTIDTMVAGHLVTDLLATVQETLSNVIRHADASRVDLEVSVNEAVTLSVVDNGIGMAGNSLLGGGHGMVNMRTRAERLGGTLDVSRPASGGTHIRWRVPLLVSH